MLTAIALPAIPFRRMPLTTVSHAIPLTSTISEELHQVLPVATIEVVDRLWAQIRTQILDPLLYAGSVEEAARTFERLYPKFWDYYLSSILTVWAALEEDPQRLSSLTIPAFEASQHILRERGPRWLGQETTLTALFGLHTITRVSRVATRFLEQEKVQLTVLLDEDLAREWATWIIAYGMAASGVLCSLTSGKRLRGRRDNITQLAYWSKGYAVKVYDLAKHIGLLQILPPPGPSQEASDEEDLLLAEVGLDDYRQLLATEEA